MSRFRPAAAYASSLGTPLVGILLIGLACSKAPSSQQSTTPDTKGPHVEPSTGGSGSIPPAPPAELILVPERVSNHYPSESTDAGCSVTADRSPDGWKLTLVAAGRESGGDQAWAGYCWDLNLVDLRSHGNLHVVFSEVAEAAELQFKLEGEDNRNQDRVLRFSASEVVIPLDSFPHVRDKVARFCLILAGKLGSADATRASFTVSQAVAR